jgi:hypothetical protein
MSLYLGIWCHITELGLISCSLPGLLCTAVLTFASPQGGYSYCVQDGPLTLLLEVSIHLFTTADTLYFLFLPFKVTFAGHPLQKQFSENL